MNTIICPTILFINDNDWKDDNVKENFIINLENTLEYMLTNNIKLYWNDVLEELLWSFPNLLPWYDSESYKIVECLKKCVIFDNNSCDFEVCNINPKIITNITNKDIISPTLSLFHYIITNSLDTSFIVDEHNNKKFTLSCKCHNKSYCPNIIYINEATSDNISIHIDSKWTNFKNNENILKELISLYIEESLNNSKILYDLEFTNSFLSDISSDYKNRNNIISSIANRVIRYQKDACNFASLDDEPINGTNGRTRSFRVNGECRIHYTYPDKGIIKLTEYSGLGEHQKKLSHTRR